MQHSSTIVVFVQLGGQKKELRPVESNTISPKHRSSLTATANTNVEISNAKDTADSASTTMTSIQHQHSLDSTAPTSVRQIESSQFDVESFTAEPLEKILEHKAVREKRLEMEKKLDSLRKKHDKEKVKICGSKLSPMDSSKKPKFAITNKLVKRLSNKNL